MKAIKINPYEAEQKKSTYFLKMIPSWMSVSETDKMIILFTYLILLGLQCLKTLILLLAFY